MGIKRGKAFLGFLIIILLISIVPVSAFSFTDWIKNLFNIGEDKDLGGGLATLGPGEKGLVAHYKFENNALDSSGNGNNGVNNGAVFVDGKSGKALKFDGNDYVSLVGSNILMPNPSSWTISAWFKASSITSNTGSGGNRIITFHRGSTRTAVSLMVGADNKARICYSNSLSGGGDTCTPILSSTISANTWYFFTATYDGTNVRMYINNNTSIMDSKTLPTFSLDNAFIGRGEDSGSYYFNGTIDEVKIWNYALTPLEILGEYSSVIPIQTCTDTDNGLNYYIRGETTGLAYPSNGIVVTLIDHCFNSTSLNEGGCGQDNYTGWYLYNCQHGCLNGVCNTCTSNCVGKNCGSDGCGGSCGTCLSGYVCNATGKCVLNQTCTPKTCSQLGKSCGTWDNGCGVNINCGVCPIEQLVAHYKFEDNVQDSQGNYPGTPYGNFYYILGSSGNAIHLDGYDDYITLGNVFSNELKDKFTISAWIKLDSGALQKSYNYIFHKYDDGPGFKIASTGQVSFAQYHTGINNGFASSTSLDELTWYHIVYTFDGLIFKGYIDGSLVGSMPKVDYFPGTTVRIGRDEKEPSYGRFFKGGIDEVKIWNYALSDNEVLAEYNSITPQNLCGDGICQPDAQYIINDGETITAGTNTISVLVEDTNTASITVNGVTESKDEGWAGTINNVLIYVQNVAGPNVAETIRYVELRVGENSGTCNLDCINQTTCTAGWKCKDNLNQAYQYPSCAWESTIYCPYGCSDGACLVQGTCAESDNGKDIYNRGTTCLSGTCENDTCLLDEYGNDILTECYCESYGEGEYINENNGIRCNGGCLDGACKKITPVQNDVCQDLINKVANPEDLTIDWLEYYSNNWNYNYSGEWWINDHSYTYNEYSASWYAYNQYDYDENNQYEYANVYLNVIVFDDEAINLTNWIKEKTSYQICQVDTYWDFEDRENIVYICSWDILTNNQDLDNYNYNSRQVFWVNNNVVVEMNVYSGRSLTNEEVLEIGQKRVNDFLSDLRDNQAEYVGWEVFDIGYLAREFLIESLIECGSDLERPVRQGTNETCYPSWSCKIEPVICPPHGYQKRTCIDYGCNQEKREEQIYCSPGMCSGCIIPRWFQSSENICMPYGFRFEQDVSMHEELREYTDEERIEESGGSDEYSLVIESDEKAVLTLYDRNGQAYIYDLVPGTETIIEIPNWDDEISKFVIKTNDIYYSTTEGVKSYVDVTIVAEEWTNVRDTINAYCDYTGEVKQQKTKDSNGNWASCQNNYECRSNVCSSGECMEVADMIRNAKGYKSTFVKIFCKLAHLFSIENYEECVQDRLGIVEPITGGSGGSSSA